MHNISSHTTARNRGWGLKNLLDTLHLVFLNDRQRNIAKYRTTPYTHVEQGTADTINQTIIDYMMTSKHHTEYIRLCRVILDSHKKILGDNDKGVADHELILVEIKVPPRKGVDRDVTRPNFLLPKPTERLTYHDTKLDDLIIKQSIPSHSKKGAGPPRHPSTIYIHKPLLPKPTNKIKLIQPLKSFGPLSTQPPYIL